MRGRENPEGETYAYEKIFAFLESLKKDPEKMRKFRELALKRAEDIFESSGLEQELTKDSKVLYIGAGTGHVPEYIQEQTGANVTKLDLMDIRTEDTKESGGESEFVQGNARHLPFPEGSFDAVCVFDMMHHTENQDEIIKEAQRVLKPGGKFMAMEDTIPYEFQKSRGIMKKVWFNG
jgi:ubiquinone/menaquinone biosynthesis C-methylase UbiE